MAETPPGAPPGPETATEVEAIVRAVEAGEDTIAVPEVLLAEEEAAAVARSPETLSLYARILTMGQAEKIKLALRGNKDARMILVRDASKMIRRLVLMNPRISDSEVISVARNRSAEEELLRLIADRREWMRNYQVRLALVTNPKTPLAIALRQLGTLGERDLRALAKSKNVAASVVSQARRMVASKGGGGQ
jgi:hypothetical protein